MLPFTITIKGEVICKVLVDGFTESEVYELEPYELIEGNLLSTDYLNLQIIEAKAK